MRKNRSTRVYLLVSMGSMLLAYGVFFIFPMLYGLVGSFTNWNPFKKQFDFIGLENYRKLFADELFYKSFWNTLAFTVVCTVATTALGMLLAVLIMRVRRKTAPKTMVYMPYITSIVTIAVVWKWFFAARGGLFNSILAAFGMRGLDWLDSARMVWPSIAMMTIWHDIGFALILYIAGIAEIPESYYEAAAMDGAGRFAVFSRITLPLLMPTTAIVAVSNIITYMQVYDQIIALTRGGPGDSSYSISYYLFNNAIQNQRFGFAAATAVVMLVMILLLSMLQMKASARQDG